MSRRGDHGSAESSVDVFVSYSPADERWAAWIGWQLEAAGYRTLVQAWDHVPGSTLVDFMERGIRTAAVTLAVLSHTYLTSQRGTVERQAALRGDPATLVTVRVEDCPLDGLPPDLTHLDLARVDDARMATANLLARMSEVLGPRPGSGGTVARPGAPGLGHPLPSAARGESVRLPSTGPPRRIPVAAPAYPPTLRTAAGRQEGVSLLHVAGPRFGRGIAGPDDPVTARELQDRIHANVTRLTDAGVPAPQLVVVSGDLTETARPRQLEEAWTFLTGLRVVLGLEAHRLVVVPGGRDVSRPACESYFNACEARETTPLEPFYPKLELYAELFADLYQGLDEPLFDSAQPWTLFTVPELRVAVAALNSTMAVSHRPRDNFGRVGDAQAAWFAERLRSFEDAGWLRVGVVRHDPLPGNAGADDPAALRDADTLIDLLGNRLNLLLHGPGPGGTNVELLGSGLPVLPAAGAGRDEIVHLTVDGLRRFAANHSPAGEPTERLARQWLGATSTFAATVPDPVPELPETSPVPEIEAARDPQGLLLARIADVCAASYPEARIRRVDTEPPQLLVTRQEDGFALQRRVGAHVGALTQQVVDDFLRHDRTDGCELVYQGPPPTEALRQQAARRHVRLRSFTEFQGLLDLSAYVSEQTLRLRNDSVYPPELYVPQRFRQLGRNDNVVRDDLVEELMDLVTADEGRFVLVLGDFGRGKSFALREVARRIAETAPDVIPILIDLAALDRSHSVDGLVAAHLAQHGEDRIDLRAFHYMLDEGRIVLLFDGFDELVTRISYDSAADHLENLLQAARGKAKIVVASRTQHFKTHTQVFTALGERVGLLPHRRVLDVEDFTGAQIRAYLVNRCAGDEVAADARFQLLAGIGDILGLAQNPRMLSFIADLDEERIRATVRNRHTISPAELYREILQSWMSHENRRATSGPGAAPGLDGGTLWEAVTTLALRLWESGEHYARPAQLAEVTDALTGLAADRLSSHQRAHAVGSGSLLIRTDEGLFGFIHASVMEWLVAKAIADQFATGSPAPALLSRRPLTQLTVDFVCDLADTHACRSWADAVLTGTGADDVVRDTAHKVRTRLDTPTTADLRGADLRGQDLSYRDFSDVDLTGADLTDSNLAGVNLSGANLVGARLVGTRLDQARLVGADLSGADLSRARLSRVDLTGATVAGSRWHRAALIDARGVPNAVELRSAAIAPGSPVATELAPSTIGVRHGFPAETGRLPQVLAYSPDGGTVATGSDDGGVLVCDTATGLPLRTLQGHRGRVFAVNHGSDVLVTGAGDGTVRVWDAATGRALHVLEGHQGRPWPVVLDPPGHVVATGDGEGVLRLWDVASGLLRHRISSAGGFVVDMAIHGGVLAAAHHDGPVRLWDTATGTSVGELAVAHGTVAHIAFSPATGEVVTAGRDGTVRGWDPATGRQVFALEGHPGGVRSMALHPTAALLVAGDGSGGVRVWDTAAGQTRHTLTGHDAAIYCVVFSPSGDTIASGDSAGAVHLWETRTGQHRHALTGHTGSVWPFAFRPDGAQLAISDDQFTTRLWDTATGQCRHVVSGHGRQVVAVRFSADGALVAASGNDGTVRLWDPMTGRQVRKLVGSEDRLVRLQTAVFSPTRPSLAMVSDDGRLNLLDLAADRYERHLNVESAPIWAVAFSPSGDELATANDDDTVRVWSRTTGRLVHTLAEHRGRVRSIAFSADGSQLATGCDDSQVRLWDASSGTLLRTLHGHTDRVYAVAFGRGVLASASWDSTARVWDVESGRARHVLGRHISRLWTVAFDPSGALLATAGDDLVIRLWDPLTGDHLQTLTGHTHSVWSVTFNPAGDLLASAGDDGTARLWSVADGQAARRLTLLGLPHGWAALAPDGRYKVDGDVEGQFWHVVGMCRFETGELDGLLPEIRQLPPDTPF